MNKQLLVINFNYFEAEPVPKKDKLTKLKVEVGDGKEVTIVTNAKHCEPEKVLKTVKVLEKEQDICLMTFSCWHPGGSGCSSGRKSGHDG